jgi:tetratricopeptide (TPR) repeat protein
MTVDPTTLARALALLDEVLDAPKAVRVEVVRRLSGGDPDLERELILLADEAETDDPAWDSGLSGAAPDLLADLAARDAPDDASLIGRTYGPWKVIGILGRGGMGVVCHVVREHHFEMEAALKVVSGGAADVEVQRRFARERQLLAALEHPGIARLLDGGVTEEGTPYLVMEKVDGRPIDAWCDDRQLGLEARVGLMIDVCDAVAHAHHALVVHRDLKPSNVFVDDTGRVRLLDFGVASFLEERDDGAGEPHAPLTPEAAAPEQLRGEAVGTDTDVWALGLLLDRLLTGDLAFPRAASLDDLVASRSTGPSPVSERAATTQKPWARRLRGDLEAVVARALQPDRGRRYQTVDALAADLRAWCERRPVSARPLGLVARSWRLINRHRVATAALALALVAAIGGAAVSARQARQARMERDRSAAVEAFLTGLFRGADPFQNAEPDLTARELVERGTADLDSMFESDPEVAVRLADTLGWVWIGLGDVERARAQFLRALYRQEELLGPSHPDTAWLRIGFGSTLAASGELDEAENQLQRAVADLRPLGPSRALGQALHTLAQVFDARGMAAEQAEVLKEALAVRRRVLTPPDSAIAATLSNLSGAYDDLGREEESLALQLEALEMLRVVRGDEHPDVASMTGNLGLKLAHLGRWDECIVLLRRSLDVAERTAPAARELGGKYTNLGKVLLDLGRIEEAAPLIRRGLELARERLPATAFTRLACEVNAATLDRELGRFDDARTLYLEVLEEFVSILGADHEAVARVRVLLADNERLAGDPGRARALLERADAVQRQVAVEPLHRSETLLCRGLLSLSSAPEAARDDLAAALELRAGRAPDRDWRRWEGELGLALADGRSDDAGAIVDRLAALLGRNHPRVRWFEAMLSHGS